MSTNLEKTRAFKWWCISKKDCKIFAKIFLYSTIVPLLITYFLALYAQISDNVFEWSFTYFFPISKFGEKSGTTVQVWVIQSILTMVWLIWKKNDALITEFQTKFCDMQTTLNTNWGDLQEQHNSCWSKLDHTIKKKEVVFNIDMSTPYEREHIEDLNKRLISAFGNPNLEQSDQSAFQKSNDFAYDSNTYCKYANIYAVDGSSPHCWWSESMLGYLAVQSKWKAEDAPPFFERQLSRVFVWSPANMISPLGTKLITLHCLFGFNTYVIQKQHYAKLHKTILKNNKFFILDSSTNMKNHFGLKEFVVWDGYTEENPDYGYRSFWNLMKADDPDRDNDPDFNDKTAKDQKPLKWRSFENGEANDYLEFFRRLIANHCEVKSGADFVDKLSEWNASEKEPIFKINTNDTKAISNILEQIAKTKYNTNKFCV